MARFTIPVVAALVFGLAGVGAEQATACDCTPAYKKVIVYRTVTCTETKVVPYQKAVVRYDHCGCPYTVYETCYRTVEVTVTKQVPVVKYVPVCD